MLVLGDNYAINLGPMVYDAFYEHANEFNILTLKGCDTMVRHQKPNCKVKVNYTEMLETLKPDVIFVLQRHLVAKKKLNYEVLIDDDEVFQEQLAKLNKMEQIAKKVYILQALPSLRRKNYDRIYSVKLVKRLEVR
ncbi:hypothetical protein OSTOST_17144 [Ostertagia ostertagi]